MIAFRRLARSDLPRLHGWLQQPHVREWYIPEIRSYGQTVEKYAPRTEDASAVKAYVVVNEGADIGYIQSYALDSFPDYAALLDAEANLHGIDLFIGERGNIRRGLGVQAPSGETEQVMRLDRAAPG